MLAESIHDREEIDVSLCFSFGEADLYRCKSAVCFSILLQVSDVQGAIEKCQLNNISMRFIFGQGMSGRGVSNIARLIPERGRISEK